MDWDLWGSSYSQDDSEIKESIGHGWESDFYLGHEPDMTEENALNEKSCNVVLRILITEADSEIEKLEEDLITLQNQLEWAEDNRYEEWSEICCSGLRKTCDSLEISMQRLKTEMAENKNDKDINVHPLTYGEPAKKINEIFEALLTKHREHKAEQPAEVVVRNFTSDALRHAAAHLDENQKNDSIREQEVMGAGVTLADNGIIPDSDLNPEGKRTHLPDTVKVVDVIVKDCQSNALIHATGDRDEMKNLSSLDSKIIEKEEIKEPRVTFTYTRTALNSSLSDGKRTNVAESDKEAGVAATDDSTGLNSPLKLHHHRAKKTIKSEPAEVQEPGIAANDKTISSNFSSNSSVNMKRKKKNPDIALSSSNQSANARRAENLVQPILCGAQEPNVSMNSLLSSQDKKRKKTVRPSVTVVKELNIVSIEFSSLHRDTTENSTNEDPHTCRSCDIDGPPNHNDLKTLTVIELKALARQRKVKGYAKMPKSKLRELLTQVT